MVVVTYLTEATLGRVSLASDFQGYSPAQGERHVCEGVSTGIQGRWSHRVHGQEAEGEKDMTVNARAGFFSPFSSVQPPTYGLVPTTFRVGLLP